MDRIATVQGRTSPRWGCYGSLLTLQRATQGVNSTPGARTLHNHRRVHRQRPQQVPADLHYRHCQARRDLTAEQPCKAVSTRGVLCTRGLHSVCSSATARTYDSSKWQTEALEARLQ